MTTDAIIVMIAVCTVVWGGLLALVLTAGMKERRKGLLEIAYLIILTIESVFPH